MDLGIRVGIHFRLTDTVFVTIQQLTLRHNAKAVPPSSSLKTVLYGRSFGLMKRRCCTGQIAQLLCLSNVVCLYQSLRARPQ